ncbi:type IV pilus assembly protein PilM, partial [Candidatus Sumerlaeota bacterium]|nr:type IV pilus assembly protein PilM [Candidatus Sumerlaeota bacterium]
MAKIRQCLGIDIGAHSIRIAEVALKSDGVEIRNLVEDRIEIDPGLSDAQRQSAITSQINALLKSNKIKTRNAVFCVPGQTVFVRQIKVPATTPERLHRIVHFEAREQIPFPLDQTSLEYQVFPTGNSNELEVLLAAIKKESIDGFMKLVRKTGLIPLAISVSSLALHNFHEINSGPSNLMERIAARKPAKKKPKKGKQAEEQPEEEESAPALEFEEILAEVNLGASMMDLAIPKAGPQRAIGFTRTVPVAGAHMDRAIRQKLNLPSAEQAIQVKEQQTAILSSDFELSSDVDTVNMAASQAATQVVNTIIAEVRRSLDFFISQPDGVAVDGIVLSGGLAKMKYLANYIEEKMGLPVTLASVKTEKITVPEELSEQVSSFAIPIGLAFQGVGLAQLTVDFLPQDIKNVRAFTENKIQLVAAGVMLLLTIGMGTMAGQKYIEQKEYLAGQYNDLVTKNKQESDKLKDAEKANTEVQAKYANLARIITRRKWWLDFSLALLVDRPPEILVKSLDMKSTGFVTVKGSTPQGDAINKFFEGLKADTTYVQEARIEELNTEAVVEGAKVAEFTLKIQTKSRDGRDHPVKQESKETERSASPISGGSRFQ